MHNKRTVLCVIYFTMWDFLQMLYQHNQIRVWYLLFVKYPRHSSLTHFAMSICIRKQLGFLTLGKKYYQFELR